MNFHIEYETELIAQTPEDYVKLAVEWANDTERLARLRAGLRERMKNSTLCDAPAFTRELEQAYRRLWTDWCLKRADAKPAWTPSSRDTLYT